MKGKSARRLASSRDFRKVYIEGKSIKHRLFVLHYRTNDMDVLRVGFSVSKKIGNAVVRNRTKRRLKESVRKWLAVIKPGVDLVISARVQCGKVSYQAIEQAMGETLQSAGLLLEGREM